MKRKILFLLFPAFLLAKFQVTTFFPMETHLVKFIGQNEIRVKQINNRFLEKQRDIPSKDLSKLADVKVYFNFGLKSEKVYETIFKKSNPYIKIVDLSKNVKIIDDNAYFWLDPFNLRVVVKDIYKQFCKIDKFNCKFYKANYEKFLENIDETFLDIKTKIYKNDVHNVYVLDAYWFYFAKRFRLNFIKREKKHLKSDEISAFISFTNKNEIKNIINLEGSSIKIADSISKNGDLQLIENNPFEEDVLKNIRNLANKILGYDNEE